MSASEPPPSSLRLSDIWSISGPSDYKLHFARWNGHSQPLEVWARDRGEWQGWQEYRPSRDEFNRQKIFSLICVLERLSDRYVVTLSEEGGGFIGRLKLRSSYRERATRVNFENHYSSFEVLELLREPYTGRSFPGFENIHLSFEELETLVRTGRPDWKAALSSVKGIYLISDTSTGKRYVGSAYGSEGVWARWCSYASTRSRRQRRTHRSGSRPYARILPKQFPVCLT